MAFWYRNLRSPFNPLLEPALVGVWDPSNTSDSGTTFTVANTKAGGPAFTSTTASRASLSAAGLDNKPGIVMNGAVLSSAAVGPLLAGKTGCTVLQIAYGTAATAASLHHYGTTADSDFRTLRSTPGTGRLTQTLEATANVNFVAEAGVNQQQTYPDVIVCRYDTAAAAIPTWVNGIPVLGVSSGTPLGTAFGDRTFYWGSDTTGASAFPGFLGVLVVIGRVLTDAEVLVWTTYFKGVSGTTVGMEFSIWGDSIPAGTASNTAQWRAGVETLALADIPRDGGRFYRCRGPQAVALTPFVGDQTFAVAGNEIANLQGYIATFKVGSWYRPPIVWIWIGTNDVANGTALATISADYVTLLQSLQAVLPGTLFVAEKLLPRTDEWADEVTDWNANYHVPMVATAQGSGVLVISNDTFATLPGITYRDAVHPDLASGPLMASAIYPFFRSLVRLPP